MTSKSEKQSNGCGCLITLIMLGLFIATILPSLLDSSHKAKQSEAKQYVGAMNRAQQAYFIEKHIFTNDFQKLGLGIKTETKNYRYSTSATKETVFNYGIARPDSYSYRYILQRTKPPLKSYVGGVILPTPPPVNQNLVDDESGTRAILCETNSPSTTKPPQPTYKNGVLACGEGTRDLSKR